MGQIPRACTGSQTIYGLKYNSGKHVGAGLTSLLGELRKMPHEKVKHVAGSVEDLLVRYIHNFDPGQAGATYQKAYNPAT